MISKFYLDQAKGWILLPRFTPIILCVKISNPSDSFGITDLSKINLSGVDKLACRKITFEIMCRDT